MVSSTPTSVIDSSPARAVVGQLVGPAVRQRHAGQPVAAVGAARRLPEPVDGFQPLSVRPEQHLRAVEARKTPTGAGAQPLERPLLVRRQDGSVDARGEVVELGVPRVAVDEPDVLLVGIDDDALGERVAPPLAEPRRPPGGPGKARTARGAREVGEPDAGRGSSIRHHEDPGQRDGQRGAPGDGGGQLTARRRAADRWRPAGQAADPLHVLAGPSGWTLAAEVPRRDLLHRDGLLLPVLRAIGAAEALRGAERRAAEGTRTLVVAARLLAHLHQYVPRAVDRRRAGAAREGRALYPGFVVVPLGRLEERLLAGGAVVARKRRRAPDHVVRAARVAGQAARAVRGVAVPRCNDIEHVARRAVAVSLEDHLDVRTLDGRPHAIGKVVADRQVGGAERRTLGGRRRRREAVGGLRHALLLDVAEVRRGSLSAHGLRGDRIDRGQRAGEEQERRAWVQSVAAS